MERRVRVDDGLTLPGVFAALLEQGAFLALDTPASGALTCELLGWQPVQPGLIDDLDKGHYFHRP